MSTHFSNVLLHHRYKAQLLGVHMLGCDMFSFVVLTDCGVVWIRIFLAWVLGLTGV